MDWAEFPFPTTDLGPRRADPPGMESRIVSKNRLLCVWALVLALQALPAWAYLDPASGSMLLQLLVGGVAGAFVAIKLYWKRFRAFLGLGNADEAETVAYDAAGDDEPTA